MNKSEKGLEPDENLNIPEKKGVDPTVDPSEVQAVEVQALKEAAINADAQKIEGEFDIPEKAGIATKGKLGAEKFKKRKIHRKLDFEVKGPVAGETAEEKEKREKDNEESQELKRQYIIFMKNYGNKSEFIKAFDLVCNYELRRAKEEYTYAEIELKVYDMFKGLNSTDKEVVARFVKQAKEEEKEDKSEEIGAIAA